MKIRRTFFKSDPKYGAAVHFIRRYFCMKRFSIQNGITPKNNIEIKYIEYGCDEPEHLHGAIELVYIVSGSGENILNGQSVRVGRGTLMLIDYECVHSIHLWDSIKYYNILFKSSVIKDGEETDLKGLLSDFYDYDCRDGFLCTSVSDTEVQQEIEDVLYSMLEEGTNKKERYEKIISCRLDEVINLMLRNIDITVNSEIDPMISRAIEYISENSAKPLKLEDVAAKFNYTPKYFSSKLKKYSGLSFKQLLVRKKMSNVIGLLWKTDKSIDEVIHECGFSNKTFFYEMFVKVYGVKPKFIREYRNNYNKYIELKISNKKLLK